MAININHDHNEDFKIQTIKVTVAELWQSNKNADCISVCLLYYKYKYNFWGEICIITVVQRVDNSALMRGDNSYLFWIYLQTTSSMGEKTPIIYYISILYFNIYRPLPEELIKYAREDTHYLLYIYDKMRNELIERGNEQNNLLHSVIQKSTRVCSQVSIS